MGVWVNLSFGCVSLLLDGLFGCIDKMVIHEASMCLGSVILPVGLLTAGWAAEWRVHWIVVDIVRNDCLFNFMLT